ncbi:MAG: M61 family metallopeptidase [Flavobacteriales bacterium]|nr:M61 family metallopeptidase [Flavobacteriales bacterium]
MNPIGILIKIIKHMKSILVFLSSILSFQFVAQTITYQLRMPKPQNHYFEVEMTLSDFKEKELNLKLPVWAPGSYLVREFSKNLNLVKAYDENGKEIQVFKKTKNSWTVKSKGDKKIKVKYEVYAFELSVRTSFLDLTHGFVSGSGVFMYVDGYKDKSGILEVIKHSSFSTITTALPKSKISVAKDGSESFEFSNYDQLVDCPIEIGNQVVFDFTAAGVKHTVAMYGEGNFDIPTLKKDMAKVVQAASDVFGVNPNKEYVFIIHNVVDGQGGLEHTNSTTLSVNRWTYQGAEYTGFLSLVAHEYFHLWNVKRIRPIELGPFDYDQENYTSLLWVMEGFTSYYEKLILVRAGFMSKEDFLNKLQGSINYVEGSVGSRVQPVAHASFDAWIKAYRPTENSANTSMTYYSRGSVIASIIDILIIDNSKGKQCLDHFFQHLYKKYFIEMNRGFSEVEFKAELEKFVGKNLDDFYKKYIDGTEILPYAEVFDKIGVTVKDNTSFKPSFGATVREEGGKVMVKNVRAGSCAEEAGISVGDEIVGCNSYRVDQAMLEGMMNGLATAETADLLIAREEKLFSVKVRMTNFRKPNFQLVKQSDTKAEAYFNYWLR